MSLTLTHKVLFRKATGDQWLLHSKCESLDEATKISSELISLEFQTCVEPHSQVLVSEVDYLLGALQELQKQIDTAPNFIDLHMRISTLSEALITAIRLEREGSVNYISIPQTHIEEVS